MWDKKAQHTGKQKDALFVYRAAGRGRQSDFSSSTGELLLGGSADAAHCLPPASCTAPSARTCWLVCFPEQTANHFFPVPAFYHMPLPVYQSEACILMKLIKDTHTTTCARGIFQNDHTRRLIHHISTCHGGHLWMLGKTILHFY